MKSRHACLISSFFFFNDTATTEIYTLSLHDALPIAGLIDGDDDWRRRGEIITSVPGRSEEHTSESSHANISYAVFCLKKKTRHTDNYYIKKKKNTKTQTHIITQQI